MRPSIENQIINSTSLIHIRRYLNFLFLHVFIFIIFLICTISIDIHWNKLFKTFASDLFKGSLVISFCLFFS